MVDESHSVEEIIKNLRVCFQCGTCAGACPVFRIDPKRNPALALYDIGGYENAETKLFENHIKKGDVVLDVHTAF